MIALKDLMDHLAGRLVGNGFKNVSAYPKSPVQTPSVVVGYPTRMDFDIAFGRGGDTFEFPVWFIVSKDMTEESRNKLSDIIAGAHGVKAVLEDNPMSGTSVHVTDCTIEMVTIGGAAYLAANFMVEIITQNG